MEEILLGLPTTKVSILLHPPTSVTVTKNESADNPKTESVFNAAL